MSKKKKPATAAELMACLRSDPEWVRKDNDRADRRAARDAQLKAELEPEEGPLVIALRDVGTDITSVWDLVNTNDSYPAAIPILVKHLAAARHPKLREEIARSLAVKEAKGLAGHRLVQELAARKDPSGSQGRWALAVALTVAADITLADAIQTLVADSSYADVHELLKEALTNLRGE